MHFTVDTFGVWYGRITMTIGSGLWAYSLIFLR